METGRDLGSKITADGDCSHEIKRHLFLRRKATTNPDSVIKSRHYFVNKGPSSQSLGFDQQSCMDESWTIKKAEHQKIDAFELQCWKRLLRVPWTARKSNQSVLKEKIHLEHSLEGLMLKLKLQYFGHLMQRADSLQKTLMLGKIDGRRRRGQQRIRWLDGITYSMDMSLSKVQELKNREAWGATVHRLAGSQT